MTSRAGNTGEGERTNPYSPPLTDPMPTASPTSLPAGEQLSFFGAVTSNALHPALGGRPNVAGLATFAAGAVICIAAAGPQEFLNPFHRPRWPVALSDPLTEQLGLLGLGFVVLALWHLIYNCTSIGVQHKERYLLSQNPNLYSEKLSGCLTNDYYYQDDSEHARGESWLRWPALNHLQTSDGVTLLEWGSGASGTTVMTEAMFANRRLYEQATRLLREKQTSQFDHQAMQRLDDYFFPVDDQGYAIWPSEELTKAECEHRINYRQGIRSVLLSIPKSVFFNSMPLHAFFGIMALLAIVFVRAYMTSLLGLLAIWISIVVLAILIAMSQTRHFVTKQTDRLLATKYRFTDEDVHVASTVGYFRVPLTNLSVLHRTHACLVVGESKPGAASMRFEAARFRSPDEWVAVQKLFAKA